MPIVQPNVLKWARETAGLELDEAASKIGLADARGVSGAKRLAALEQKASEISRSLLHRISKEYRRPLVAFYLGKPPARGDRGEDFRTVVDPEPSKEALLDALLRDVRARQQMVREVLLFEEEVERLAFINSMQIRQGPEAVRASIEKVLQFDLRQFRRTRSVEASFAYLRQIAEAAGVFVLLIGNLGSHHTDIPVEVFRGFALADDVAPFVVINDKDAKAAWSFTLLHELVHLWLGATGVSGGPVQSRIEKFSNDVAGQILFPDVAEVAVTPDTPFAGVLAAVREAAEKNRLSHSLVAYRLLQFGKISEETWQRLSKLFRDQWRQAAKEAENQENGPSYYVVRRHRLGQALISLVSRGVMEGYLTPTKAGKVLGVKPGNVANLIDGVVA